jgi:cytochrome c oxidase cbb3-type subunit 4
MMTMSYDALRQFADSWGLALLTVVFVSAIVWAMRPGARNAYREQADIPFKHDEKKD